MSKKTIPWSLPATHDARVPADLVFQLAMVHLQRNRHAGLIDGIEWARMELAKFAAWDEAPEKVVDYCEEFEHEDAKKRQARTAKVTLRPAGESPFSEPWRLVVLTEDLGLPRNSFILKREHRSWSVQKDERLTETGLPLVEKD